MGPLPPCMLMKWVELSVPLKTHPPRGSPSQVTWIYEPKDGTRSNIAVLHSSFQPNYPDSPLKGRVSFTATPPSLDSPSIQITDVRMTDEGQYICVYATYPGGNEQGITELVMLGEYQGLLPVFIKGLKLVFSGFHPPSPPPPPLPQGV